VRLRLLVVRVRDVAASASFYRDAFGVPFEGANASLEGIELRLATADEASPPNVELGFVVDELEAAHARAVRAGAAVVGEPRDEAAGRTANYRDPDGNVVTLTERPRALRVAGVELARGSLAVVVLEGNRVVEAFRCETVADALLVDARIVAVDIPIGIPDTGARAADVAARQFLGDPAYVLRRRVIEVDEYAHSDERVIEVHPEVSFRELAHRPLASEHRLEGLVERRALLEEEGLEVPASAPRIAEPDLLDATVAAWTARRYALGQAVPLPEGHTARIGAIWR
jgi:predicted RNase H-like nuclease/predicted enzyme related to lactoylglutathione lyase